MGQKNAQASGRIPSKQMHLHARLSYLHEASTCLDNARQASQQASTKPLPTETPAKPEPEELSSAPPQTSASAHTAPVKTTPSGESQRLLTSLRAISQRAQIQISPYIKRNVCGRCNTLLVPPYGSSEVHNASRNGKKAHADVLLVACGTCGAEKRYPMGMERGRGDREELMSRRREEGSGGRTTRRRGWVGRR